MTNIAYEVGLPPTVAATILTYAFLFEIFTRPTWSFLQRIYQFRNILKPLKAVVL